MASLSGCTHLTLLLPKPFLTPEEQPSDPGLENLIRAPRLCLSYVLIPATWADPGFWGTTSLPSLTGDSFAGQAGQATPSSLVPSCPGSFTTDPREPAQGQTCARAGLEEGLHVDARGLPGRAVVRMIINYMS